MVVIGGRRERLGEKEEADQSGSSKINWRDFPGGPVVENPPSNAGDEGSILGQGTKIPHASGELRSHTPPGN